MTLTVKHAKTNTQPAWTQPILDSVIAGNAPPLPAPGTTIADITLSTDWNSDHSFSGTLDIVNGGTGQSSANGALNALLPTQTGQATKYLQTNGINTSWVAGDGSGTVTSIDVSGGTTGLTTSGGPVTTSGTITLAGTLAVPNGGTGQTSYTNGQLLIGNTTGNTLTKATLTGTVNQVIVTNGGGSITLSTPQDIAVASSPTFNALSLNASTNQIILDADGTFTGTITMATLTGSSKAWTFPNNSGTVLLTTAAQTVTNKDLTGAGNIFPTFNQNTTGTAASWTTARLLAGNSVDGSANVPFNNKFIVQGTSDTGLTGAQFMGALGTGLVKNSTTTGVQSIAVANTDYQSPISLTTTGTGAATFISNVLNIPQTASYTPYAETPSGTINGSNTIFTLVNTPANSAGVIVMLNRLVQRNGIDYTISGATITFTFAPATNSEIYAQYNTYSSGVGLPFVTVTSSATLVANRITYVNSASLVTLSLPSTYNQNDIFQIIGMNTGAFKVAQTTATQIIRLISTATTLGTGGSIQANNGYNSIVLRGLVANADLSATGPNGSFTVI